MSDRCQHGTGRYPHPTAIPCPKVFVPTLVVHAQPAPLPSLLLCLVLCTCVRAQKALRVTNPRVEYHAGNAAIDVEKPRFSWELAGEGRNRRQTAYELKVLNEQGVVWNSGKVKSNATNQIEYDGQPLQSNNQYQWTVTSYDENDQPSTVSGGSFRTGLLRFSDWQGLFISHYAGYDTTDLYKELYLPPARYLRKEFTVAGKQIKRATAYTTALGLYELRINEKKVGEQMFLPGWTDYNKRLYYQTFDVKPLLEAGNNAVGVILADGWYAGYLGYALLTRQDKVREFYGVNPAFMGQIHVEYTDGTTEIIASDETWQSNTGPILEADILMGETYDARKEHTGWDRPGFAAAGWQKPRRYTYPNGRLQAYPGDYVMPREMLQPVNMTEPAPGTYIYDLGKNIAGIIELKVDVPAGTEITIRYGELLRDEDGGLMTGNLRKARATDTYVAKGGGVETWRPRFTYHGFQYVELTGLPAKPAADVVTGIALSSITTDAGEFSSSNPMNNQLFKNIKTTQAANFFEVPTDCPQRDERLGWTGDAQTFARSATYTADVAAFFTKWLVDLDDSQRWYGAYPNFAPFPFSRPEQYSPAWMDAGVITPYTIYKVYNDTRALEVAWAGMEQFMAFQADAAGDDYLRPGAGNNWGDWLTTGAKTSDDFIASSFYGYDAMLMAEMAAALGKEDRAAHYHELFGRIKSAFGKKYLRPDGSTTEETQTALALALYFDLYPEELAPRAAELLAMSITDNGDKFSTGFLGTKHVMLVLSEYGHHDLAYRLFQQTEYPSWGFSVVNGSTSVWERWNSYTKDADSNEKINAAMNSFSHYAFGSVAEWMYRYGLGIETQGAGFREIIIKPAISKEINEMAGSYVSINGKIATAWKRTGKKVTVDVTIPVNTVATVYLPGRTERIGSGTYAFEVME